MEIEEEIGVAGQGNNDPRSEFGNHAIVKNKTTSDYYDPSYGSEAVDENTWETNAFDGFGSVVKYNDGTDIYYINWIGQLNNSTLQSEIYP